MTLFSKLFGKKKVEVQRTTCPNCGSESAARIAYGLPGPLDEKTRYMLENKEIIFGGCIISDDSPTHQCNSCGKRFGTVKMGGRRFKRRG